MQPRIRQTDDLRYCCRLALACGKIPKKGPPRSARKSTWRLARSALGTGRKEGARSARDCQDPATRRAIKHRLKLEQAKSEQQAKQHYQRFVREPLEPITTPRWRPIGDMAQGSYYRALAKSEHDRILPSYIEDHLEKATSATFNGRCADAKQQLSAGPGCRSAECQGRRAEQKPCTRRRTSLRRASACAFVLVRPSVLTRLYRSRHAT